MREVLVALAGDGTPKSPVVAAATTERPLLKDLQSMIFPCDKTPS
jgi:hypothetical protein